MNAASALLRLHLYLAEQLLREIIIKVWQGLNWKYICVKSDLYLSAEHLEQLTAWFVGLKQKGNL